MRHLQWLCVAVLALTPACKTTDRGFGVELALSVDSSVSDADIGAIKHLRFDVTGDESESTTYDFTRAAFPGRQERVVYRPLTSSHSIAITVSALDDGDNVIASGSSGVVALIANHSAHASATLSATTAMGGDMGAGGDGGVVRTLGFAFQVAYPVAEPIAEAVADFDGDGKNDVAIASFGNSNNLTILKNAGSFSFTPTSLTVGSGLTSIVAMDLNNDLKPDLALGGTDGIYVLINKGDGTFKPAVTYAGPKFVAAGDATNDGKPDLVGISAANVTVFANNGDGTFTAGSPITLANYAGVVVADVNTDTKPDIIAYGGTAGTVAAVLLNSGTGFQAPVTYGTVSSPSVVVGDVTDDGKVDLVYSDNGTGGAFVIAGNGNGTFSTGTPVLISNATVGAGLALGDLSGDGKLDILAFGGGIDVILNKGGNTFASAVGYDGNGALNGIAADIDGDGHLDVVGGAIQALTVSLVRGNGDGTLADGYSVGTGSVGGLTTAVAGDVNGDQKPDLIGINAGIGVLTDVDGRTFAAKMQITANNAAALTLGDINGDQKADIISANGTGNSISVYTNAGDGTFPNSPSSLPAGTRVSAVVAADFTGDGKIDVAAENVDSKDVSIFVNSGSALASAGSPISLGVEPSDIAAGDTDGDKKVDLVVALGASNAVVVLKGGGDGTFTAGTPITVGTGPVSVKLGDLDGDGHLDIVTANTGKDLSVLLNDGSGGFKPVVSYKIVVMPAAVVLADFNLDGKLDMVTAGLNPTIGNNTGSVVAFTGNGDGTFGSSPLVGIVSLPTSIAVGDFDGDGLPDLALGSNIVPNTSR